MAVEISIKTMLTLDGRSVDVVDLNDASGVIGCDVDDIRHWLEEHWLPGICCEHCQATYVRLDETLDIAARVAFDQVSSFDEIMCQRYDELHAQAMQRRSDRETKRLSPVTVPQSKNAQKKLPTRSLEPQTQRCSQELRRERQVDLNPLDRRLRTTDAYEEDGHRQQTLHRLQPGRR